MCGAATRLLQTGLYVGQAEASEAEGCGFDSRRAHSSKSSTRATSRSMAKKKEVQSIGTIVAFCTKLSQGRPLRGRYVAATDFHELILDQ